MSFRIESTVSLRRWLTQLVAFFVLATSVTGHAVPQGTLEILTTATIETRTVGDMEKLFAITERVMLNNRLYRFFNEAFPEQLVIPEDLRAQYDGKEKAEGLSTTQVMYILNNVRSYWHFLDEYEAKVTDENFEKPTIKEYRKEIAKFIKDEIAKKNLDSELAKLNRPTQPVHLKVAGQKVAYSGLETYINHPYLLEPDDENSQLGTSDDLQQVAIDFVKGAKTSIMSNVFEFNLPKLAQAFIDQKKKDLDVTAGVDKNTSELDERNKAVTKMLTDALGENFVLVDPTGLNHQKIIVRDWGTANAAILFLSGNFTQSCIGKEGDAVDLPESQRPKESIPNANHAIFMKGRLPALIAQYQLRKTLIHKLRGESKYPTDGSYLLEGEFINEMNMPGFVAIAFSPNGGMGNVNTDLLKQIILRSVGPIEFAQFAMSSQAVIDAIMVKLKEKKAAGQKLDLKMVGDPPFAMQFWSAFLELSGITRMDDGYYETPPNTEIRKLFDTEQEFKAFQEQLRVDPDTFGEKHLKIDGKDVKLTAKIHHKVMALYAMFMVVAGTSFNVSDSAEGNTEQLMLIMDKKVAKKITGMIRWLYKTSPYSVAENARRKNAFGEARAHRVGANEFEGKQEENKGRKTVKKKNAKKCDTSLKTGETEAAN